MWLGSVFSQILRRRERNLELANEQMQLGNQREAYGYYLQAVDVTPHMAHLLILV